MVDITPFIGHYGGHNGSEFDTAQALITQQVRTLFDGGAVQRFHTMPTLTDNTVAQHSHGVAVFCYLIDPACSKDLLLAALMHDLAEQYTGDVPSPSKRVLGIREAFGKVEQELLGTVGFDIEHRLSEHDEIVLKLADCADGMMFCVRERTLGNRSKMLKAAFKNYQTYVHQASEKLDDANARSNAFRVMKAINNMWKESK